MAQNDDDRKVLDQLRRQAGTWSILIGAIVAALENEHPGFKDRVIEILETHGTDNQEAMASRQQALELLERLRRR